MHENWHLLLLNPESIEMLYSTAPSLEQVELRRVQVEHDAPSVTLDVHLADFPDKPSTRWHPDFNSIQLTLRFFDVTAFRAEGMCKGMKASLSISKERDKPMLVEFGKKSTDCSLSFCSKFFRVEKVSPFRDVPVLRK